MLSEEHQEFRAALRRFAEKEIAPHASEVDEQETYPHASLAAVRDSGFVRALYPPEYGGGGGGLLTTTLVIEELARACASTALTTLVTRTAATAIVSHGSDELKRRYLPGVVTGEQQASYCLSEPNAGSDVASMTTRAVRDGDHWILNGRKAWITTAGKSSLYTVFARTGPDDGSRGISAFRVEPDWPGFSIGKLEHKIGMRGSPTGEVLLDNVAVPAEN